MLRVLVIDDEKHIREMLAGMLLSICADVEVVGGAEGVKDGLAAIRNLHPDLILLDVELADGNGFDILHHYDELPFKVIFVTAFEEYAVKAFQISAIDYILKPVDPDELKKAVEKAIHTVKAEFLIKMGAFFENMNHKTIGERKIVLKTADSVHLVKICEIIHCDSDQNYTEFRLTEGRKIIVSRTLKDFEDLLKDFSFFRVHKSHLVNLRYIDRFDRTDGGQVVMSNGSHIPVASRKQGELLELFEKI
ncbi:MAG: response regulator transcription factor [Bacteroidales bacterium]|nr:response regulator transcription factor [Bacteroidales bacterium]